MVCDFEGQTLLDSLAHQPLLVKPNNHELEAIFNVKLNGMADIETYAKKILDMGAQNVIISMAGDGALLVTPTATYFAKPIKGTVKILSELEIPWWQVLQANTFAHRTQSKLSSGELLAVRQQPFQMIWQVSNLLRKLMKS